MEIARRFEQWGERNADAGRYACFLGGGIYDHFIPAALRSIVSRSEYATAYTPYQPEVAQGELGDVVFVELPSVGAHLAQMKSFGTIDAVKTVSDLFAPVSGEVAAINTELKENPALINQSPYEKGWMIRIKIQNPGELDGLLSAEAYEKTLGAHA